jgi:hypothetical protein
MLHKRELTNSPRRKAQNRGAAKKEPYLDRSFSKIFAASSDQPIYRTKVSQASTDPNAARRTEHGEGANVHSSKRNAPKF